MWSKGSPSSMESSSPKQPPEELSVKLLHTTLDNNSSEEHFRCSPPLFQALYILVPNHDLHHRFIQPPLSGLALRPVRTSMKETGFNQDINDPRADTVLRWKAHLYKQ